MAYGHWARARARVGVGACYVLVWCSFNTLASTLGGGGGFHDICLVGGGAQPPKQQSLFRRWVHLFLSVHYLLSPPPPSLLFPWQGSRARSVYRISQKLISRQFCINLSLQARSLPLTSAAVRACQYLSRRANKW
ncbi:hypothetical protein T492DRAFT_75430 [Pavlovales sp. CCMP2436]|nr:hypothetical protein T492DRAFT_75430 [Pavlovales sp. CCMP2436]